jgi:hypothetical protein
MGLNLTAAYLRCGAPLARLEWVRREQTWLWSAVSNRRTTEGDRKPTKSNDSEADGGGSRHDC